MSLKISDNGIALIKRYEGCRLEAYKAVPTEKYWTIGYGHYSEWVEPGDKITQYQADALLLDDIARFETHVNLYGDKYQWTQNQFDALVSFAFNIGSIKQLTGNGTRTIKEISDAIPKYCKSGGKVLSGLIKRRLDEQALFNMDQTNKIAQEVIDGLWGNGIDRRLRLTKAGYDYQTIQLRVNEILKGE